ncbi:MAG: sugar phosphate nucleotidyltransferase, partial [Gammaproteobacteria bacterium]|nr:sugar phosphate nucleotidyltransferase [Gammaproteobacteria bacterium]
MKPLVPVVLAGGVGSRLWPLSRALFSKPFHALFGERSLLQNTVLRAAGATDRPPIVICNEANRFLVAEQLRALDLAWQCIALEPEGRNTGPAIALAAHLAATDAEGAQLLVLPADHLIDDAASFAAAVHVAQAASEGGSVVVFGIAPARAETGYGYIELAAAGRSGVQPVRAFVEKP